MIEVDKSDKFLVIDKEPINQDHEKAIIIKDHFAATRLINSLLFSLFALFIIYLIFKFK